MSREPGTGGEDPEGRRSHARRSPVSSAPCVPSSAARHEGQRAKARPRSRQRRMSVVPGRKSAGSPRPPPHRGHGHSPARPPWRLARAPRAAPRSLRTQGGAAAPRSPRTQGGATTAGRGHGAGLQGRPHPPPCAAEEREGQPGSGFPGGARCPSPEHGARERSPRRPAGKSGVEGDGGCGNPDGR